MTDTEMNLALCEKLGWTEIKQRPDVNGILAWSGIVPNAQEFDSQGALEIAFSLPNHFSDSASGLWACHEAEKGLTDEQHCQFRAELFRLIKSDHKGQFILIGPREYISAPAPQRARALYLTLCQP